MNEAPSRFCFLLARFGKQPIHGPCNIVIGILKLRLFLDLFVAPRQTNQLPTQVFGIAVSVSHDIRWTMAVLAGDNRDAKRERFEYGSRDTITHWSSDVCKTSRQQRQEF